jgi:peptidoglycan/LPS O-acetylase OafA/YrhL
MSGADAPAHRYLPPLDGIRALAVLAVMAFHFGVPWFQGGFLGVDAFFVLSGFLITSLLLTERARTGRIHLGAFWGRRARRLLPALLIMVLAVVIAGHYLLAGEDLHLLRGDALAAVFYVANWRMLFRGTGGYFAATAAPSPLQHTWSLGIEEQFYLIWPLLLVLVLLRWRRPVRAVTTFSVAGALVSATLMGVLYAPGTDPSVVYYSTETRCFTLLVGCALAAGLFELRQRGRELPARRVGVLAFAGAGFFVWATTYAQGAATWVFRGGLFLVALAVAAVIAHAVLAPRGLTARVLSVPPLPALGRISYGVYLWHYPIGQWLDNGTTGLNGVPLLIVRFALTFVIATVSYVFIEQPIRQRRWNWRFAVPATASCAAVVSVAAITLSVPPPPGHKVPQSVAIHQTVPATKSPSAAPTSGSQHAAKKNPNALPIMPHHHKPGAPPNVAFFGDSVSWTLGSYLPAHPGLQVEVDSMQGCGIALGNPYRYFGGLHDQYPHCPQWKQLWMYRIRHSGNPDVSVILLDRWELLDRMHNGKWMHVGEPAYDAYLKQQLRTAIRIVSIKGAHVVLLTAPYNRRGETPSGGLWPEDEPSRTNAWNRLLRQVAAENPTLVSVINLNKKVCPQGKFTWDIDGIRIRSDGMHFTPEGVKWLAPWLLPKLAAQAQLAA